MCVSEGVRYRSLAERAVAANDPHVLLKKSAYRTGPAYWLTFVTSTVRMSVFPAV